MSNEEGLQILGTGSYLPSQVVENRFFTKEPVFYYGLSGNRLLNDAKGKEPKPIHLTEEGIYQRTGILERRKATEFETPVYIGARAAELALKRSGIPRNSLAGIIVATITHKPNVPSAASLIQQQLGIEGCFAYDINVACSGFVEGLLQANARLSTRPGNYLVIAADRLTDLVDYTDINSTLFGDAAGAAVLGSTTEYRGILGDSSVCNPHNGNAQLIMIDPQGKLRMPNGGRVLKRAVNAMADSVIKMLAELEWDKVHLVIAHQANRRILDDVDKKLPNVAEAQYRTIGKYGNTSAATVAVTLDEAIQQGIIPINSGRKVILTAYGAGDVTATAPLII